VNVSNTNRERIIKAGLPVPFDVIALSLSGGGFRATAFHLGTLTYLDKVNFIRTSLIERVKVLSTVSGGTLTGALYATEIQKGNGILHCYEKLYRFMSTVDLVKESLEFLSCDNCNRFKTKNLINAFSELYYKHLIQDTFSIFWNGKHTHLTELCLNTTDFSHGLNFRFQKTLNDTGFIGNKYFQSKIEPMKEINISDIIAASSCFPGGFEPMNFPEDFRNENSVNFNKYSDELMNSSKFNIPIYIMDGGIYDNQGIDAVVLAKQRLTRYYTEYRNKVNSIDLYIISDVANPNMRPLKYTKIKDSSLFHRLSFRRLSYLSTILSITFVFLLYQLLKAKTKSSTILYSVISTLSFLGSMITGFMGKLLINNIPSSLEIPEHFTRNFKQLNKLSFGVYSHFIYERVMSLLKMNMDVFTNQVRRLSTKQIWERPEWDNRRILNASWDLTKECVLERKRKNPNTESSVVFNPSELIIECTQKTLTMETTLWFEKHQLIGYDSMLNSIIACGQYTMCFNLIEYIERLRKMDGFLLYSKEIQKQIDVLYKGLVKDWQHFNNDPYWMVQQINEKIIKGD
jgi:predicted acylesterase/phospholipase RssA